MADSTSLNKDGVFLNSHGITIKGIDGNDVFVEIQGLSDLGYDPSSNSDNFIFIISSM